MFGSSFLAVTFLHFLATVGGLPTIPNYIQVCHKSDPRLNDCMIKSIENLRPHLVKGIPDLDVPSINPLQLNDLKLIDGKESGGLSVNTKNIRAYDLGLFQLKKLEVIDYGKLYKIELFLPKVRVGGDYNINGQLLSIPLKGSGKFVANFTDITGHVKLSGDRFSKDGIDHFTVKKLDIKVKIPNGRIYLNDLFGGDKSLGDIVNTVINENFGTLRDEYAPLIEKSLARALREIGNKIAERFPYEQLFPE